MSKPNAAAFKRVSKELESGTDLTMNMVGDVFGSMFWQMLVLCLLDAGDAARAISGAINRLRMGESPDDEADSGDDIETDDEKEPS